MNNMIVYITNTETQKTKIYLSDHDTEEDAIEQACNELEIPAPDFESLYNEDEELEYPIKHRGLEFEALYFDESGWISYEE